MRPVLFALPLMLAATSAWALCPSRPDNAASHFVENQQALMLCLQDELADATALRADQAQLQADLQALQLQFEQQLRMQQMLAATQPPALPQF